VAARGGDGRLHVSGNAHKDNELATQATDKTQLNVASVDFGLTGDHRDNPLRPRNGYRWFHQVELAAAVWAGRRNTSGSNWAWPITHRGAPAAGSMSI